MSDILLVNRNDSDYKYCIKQVNNFIVDKKTGVTSMPLPEDEGDTNIVMKLMGAEVSMTIDWTITEQTATELGIPAGWGTGNMDMFKQMDYLMEYFASGQFNNSIKVYAKGTGTTVSSYTGQWGFTSDNKYADAQVESATFSFEGGLVTCKASLKIIVGLVG